METESRHSPPPPEVVAARLAREPDFDTTIAGIASALGMRAREVEAHVESISLEPTSTWYGKDIYSLDAVAASLGISNPRRDRWEDDCRRRPESLRELKERYEADPDEWVYVCRGENDDVLYVGITCIGTMRFRSHSRYAPWFRKVRRIDVEHYGSREESMAREAHLIAALLPPHNREGIESVDLDLPPRLGELVAREAERRGISSSRMALELIAEGSGYELPIDELQQDASREMKLNVGPQNFKLPKETR